VVEHRYVLADAPDDAERARLDLLEAGHDPNTRRRLSALGVGPGWRCLEVAAGGGSVARWLAEQVGPTGSVVATDMNPRFLTDLPDNVDVRRHDILVDDLETDAFDLVHCRAVLMHLPDPQPALQRMAAALKPGGWLCAEEGDWGLMTVAGHPEAAWVNDLRTSILQFGRQLGRVNTFFGRQVPGEVASLGLTDLGGDGITPVGREGDPVLVRHRVDFANMRPAAIAGGLATDEEFDRAEAILTAPGLVFVGGTSVAAWGRKPS
jgi:SAM-dependent methyltransferase